MKTTILQGNSREWLSNFYAFQRRLKNREKGILIVREAKWNIAKNFLVFLGLKNGDHKQERNEESHFWEGIEEQREGVGMSEWTINSQKWKEARHAKPRNVKSYAFESMQWENVFEGSGRDEMEKERKEKGRGKVRNGNRVRKGKGKKTKKRRSWNGLKWSMKKLPRWKCARGKLIKKQCEFVRCIKVVIEFVRLNYESIWNVLSLSVSKSRFLKSNEAKVEKVALKFNSRCTLAFINLQNKLN